MMSTIAPITIVLLITGVYVVEAVLEDRDPGRHREQRQREQPRHGATYEDQTAGEESDVHDDRVHQPAHLAHLVASRPADANQNRSRPNDLEEHIAGQPQAVPEVLGVTQSGHVQRMAGDDRRAVVVHRPESRHEGEREPHRQHPTDGDTPSGREQPTVREGHQRPSGQRDHQGEGPDPDP
ncbi:MAG: hypothetical protein ABR549_19570, partial [Mycobacteriales bacterium]